MPVTVAVEALRPLGLVLAVLLAVYAVLLLAGAVYRSRLPALPITVRPAPATGEQPLRELVRECSRDRDPAVHVSRLV